MWLRTLMKMLLWQPKSAGTAKLVQYLSETRPIRAAARATAYGILRGKHALEEGVTKPGRRAIDEARNRTDVDGNRFWRTFQHEVRKGLKEAEEKAGKKIK